MKALNLAQQRFGKLLALEKAPKRNDKHTRWICKCDCGNTTEVRTCYLTSGHTVSCGCEKIKYFAKKNLNGQRFGKLTVIDSIETEYKLCQCDCGNQTIVKTYNLTNGNTQSCGCLKSKGELKINQILTDACISYKTQYSFLDCRFPETNRLAHFDYAIFHNDQLLCLIEYDGIQHYTGWAQDKNSLEHIKKYDEYKNKYCEQKNIPLIRISYKELNKLNTEYFLNIINQMRSKILI